MRRIPTSFYLLHRICLGTHVTLKSVIEADTGVSGAELLVVMADRDLLENNASHDLKASDDIGKAK